MTHRVSRSAAAMAAWAALCVPAAARGRARTTPEPLPSGRIQQLIAAQDRLLAIRDGAVLMFAPDGSRLARCGPLGSPAPRAVRPWAVAADASETLRDAGLPDDDSTLAAEELLESEQPGGESPRPHLSPERPLMVARALAASGTSAWAATSDGVYQIGARRCARVALAGRDVSAIAAGGARLAVIAGDQLFEADLAGGGVAADRSFQLVAALPPHPRLLAVDARGTVLVAGEDEVLSVDAAGTVRRVLELRADALAACAQDVAALASDGVYLWDGQRLRRAGDRPRGRALGCGDAPQRRWLAGGAAVWSSPDGAAWTEQPGWLGATVTGMAAVAGRVWLATEAGLAPLRVDDQGARGPMGLSPDGPARRMRAPSRWRCWPTLTAALTVDSNWRSSRGWGRRTTTAFVLLRFPLDRAPTLDGAIAGLALDRTRRDADLTRLEVAAQAAAGGALDPIDADEMTAWRELAADEREALR